MIRRLLWCRAPWQAMLETLLVFSLLFDGLWSLRPELPTRIVLQGVLYICLLCGFLCAIRMHVPESIRSKILIDGCMALALGLIFAATCITVIQIADQRVLAEPNYAPIPYIGRLLIVGASGVGFVVFRIGAYLWRWWDRLRRFHLIWSLTHAHLTAVVLLAVVFIGFSAYGVTRLAAFAKYMTSVPPITVSTIALLIINLIPITSALTIVGLAGLAMILPPSAIFSFLVMRGTTRRLETLAAATRAVRAKDYGVRVAVKGEDEVAHLQADFNAMAADLEQAVNDLRTERDTVAHLLQARRDLTANVSHELRTPIATLRASLEAAIEHRVSPSAHELEIMERDTIYLQALIDDMFTLARSEVGQLTLRCQPTDVAEIIRQVVESAAPLAWRSSRVEIIADLPHCLPQAIADGSRLEQILRNLLHNSVRHTPSGGIITVSAAVEDQYIALEVWDTGEGIDAEDLPHIWDRFYRAEKIRNGDQHGAGLGLAIVKELSEAMGGSIAVESTPNVGSRFTLRLPRHS